MGNGGSSDSLYASGTVVQLSGCVFSDGFPPSVYWTAGSLLNFANTLAKTHDFFQSNTARCPVSVLPSFSFTASSRFQWSPLSHSPAIALPPAFRATVALAETAAGESSFAFNLSAPVFAPFPHAASRGSNSAPVGASGVGHALVILPSDAAVPSPEFMVSSLSFSRAHAFSPLSESACMHSPANPIGATRALFISDHLIVPSEYPTATVPALDSPPLLFEKASAPQSNLLAPSQIPGSLGTRKENSQQSNVVIAGVTSGVLIFGAVVVSVIFIVQRRVREPTFGGGSNESIDETPATEITGTSLTFTEAILNSLAGLSAFEVEWRNDRAGFLTDSDEDFTCQ
jgi:hypothetical protein